MPKSIHDDEYGVLLDLLREVRTRSGARQSDVAEAMGLTQAQVSKIENGERRLDVVELRRYCAAARAFLPDLIAEFDARVRRRTTRRP